MPPLVPAIGVKLADPPPCERLLDARRIYLGTNAHDCFPESGFASELTRARHLQLQCSERAYLAAGVYSHALTGYADNMWEEYNPVCTLIHYERDVHLFTLAEPRNAISSLRAYDAASCVEDAEFIHEPSAYLGWGSFANHGSGAPGRSWESQFDNHAMACVAMRLLYQAFSITRTPYLLEVEGKTYNISERADACLSEANTLVKRCTDDPDEEFVGNLIENTTKLRNLEPSYYYVFAAVVIGPMRFCIGDWITFPLGWLLAYLGFDASSDALSSKLVNLPAPSLADYQEGGMCRSMLVATASLIMGILFQGTFVSFVPELHHIWHFMTGQSIVHGSRVLIKLEQRMREEGRLSAEDEAAIRRFRPCPSNATSRFSC